MLQLKLGIPHEKECVFARVGLTEPFNYLVDWMLLVFQVLLDEHEVLMELSRKTQCRLSSCLLHVRLGRRDTFLPLFLNRFCGLGTELLINHLLDLLVIQVAEA